MSVAKRTQIPAETSFGSGILALQSNKRELARAALSGEGSKNLMKLTLNDIMSTFGVSQHYFQLNCTALVDLFKRSMGPDDDNDEDKDNDD